MHTHTHKPVRKHLHHLFLFFTAAVRPRPHPLSSKPRPLQQLEQKPLLQHESDVLNSDLYLLQREHQNNRKEPAFSQVKGSANFTEFKCESDQNLHVISWKWYISQIYESSPPTISRCYSKIYELLWIAMRGVIAYPCWLVLSWNSFHSGRPESSHFRTSWTDLEDSGEGWLVRDPLGEEFENWVWVVRWGRGGIGHYWVRGGELVVNLGGCEGVRVCGCEGVWVRVRVYTAHHQQTHYNIKQVDLHSRLKRIFLLSNYVQRTYVIRTFPKVWTHKSFATYVLSIMCRFTHSASL